MKLFELLTEAPRKDAYAAKSFFGTDDNAKKIVLARGKKVAQFIKTKCKPWFQESEKGKHKFYRGFQRGANEVAFTKKVRTNRQPKDSGKREHEAFNTLIKLGGGKANRSNAVFASSDRYVAEEYGQVFVVIPVGEYTYTWHDYYDDWTGMVPWGELLTVKKVEKKTSGKKKTKLELQYEELRGTYEKAVGDHKALLKKIFTDNGMKAPTPSTWWDIAGEIDMIVNYKEGTFSGAPSVKFKNVKKGKTPTVKDGYYSKSKWRKVWVEFYNYLASIPAAKRVPYVNLLKKLEKNTNKAAKGIKWLKMYKDAKDYEAVHGGTSKYGHGASGTMKNTWLPSKHKLSQLDKENPDLKHFLKGLHVDEYLGKVARSSDEIMIKSANILGVDVDFYQRVVLPMLNGKQPKISDQEAISLLHPAKDNDDW
jgi:hypothetical protein